MFWFSNFLLWRSRNGCNFRFASVGFNIRVWLNGSLKIGYWSVLWCRNLQKSPTLAVPMPKFTEPGTRSRSIKMRNMSDAELELSLSTSFNILFFVASFLCATYSVQGFKRQLSKQFWQTFYWTNKRYLITKIATFVDFLTIHKWKYGWDCWLFQVDASIVAWKIFLVKVKDAHIMVNCWRIFALRYCLDPLFTPCLISWQFKCGDTSTWWDQVRFYCLQIHCQSMILSGFTSITKRWYRIRKTSWYTAGITFSPNVHAHNLFVNK